MMLFKAKASSRFQKLEGERAAAALSSARVQARSEQKLWWEAQDFALIVCTLAGGPAVALNLAGVCKAFHQAVVEAWEDLKSRFPCRIYVVGGLNTGFHATDTAWRFDPPRGIWEALPPICNPCAGPTAVVAAGQLYVLGGESSGTALRDVQRFDPLVGRWESLPPMSVGRIRAAAVYAGGYLYVFGGLDGSQPLRTAERFNARANTWEALPPMHRPRYACAGAAQPRGCVLAFGGELTDAGLTASIERYDPEAGAWELLPAVRAPCCGAAVALTAAGSTAFTIGGLGLSGQALPSAEHLALGPALTAATPAPGEKATHCKRFVPPAWGPLPPMLTPRHLTSAAAYGTGVVAVGGKGPSFEAVSDVEVFDTKVSAWEALPPMPSPRLRAAVASGRF